MISDAHNKIYSQLSNIFVCGWTTFIIYHCYPASMTFVVCQILTLWLRHISSGTTKYDFPPGKFADDTALTVYCASINKTYGEKTFPTERRLTRVTRVTFFIQTVNHIHRTCSKHVLVVSRFHRELQPVYI